MAAKKSAKSNDAGPCILIVDDDKDILEITRDFLTARGYKVIQASTGKDALKKVESARPSLILLDVMLPKMDGFWLCRVIKADPALSRIPVIFLTAKDDAQSRLEGQKCGGDDYLTKPFDLESLEVRIKAQLKRLSKDELVDKIEEILDIGEPKGFLSKLDLEELTVLLNSIEAKVKRR